jgi:hypothetical protein
MVRCSVGLSCPSSRNLHPQTKILEGTDNSNQPFHNRVRSTHCRHAPTTYLILISTDTSACYRCPSSSCYVESLSTCAQCHTCYHHPVIIIVIRHHCEMSKNTHRGARPLNTDGMHDGWCAALRQTHPHATMPIIR